MSNKIVQKMASGGYVYLTPKKEYLFKGKIQPIYKGFGGEDIYGKK